jgi:hypothetical protein
MKTAIKTPLRSSDELWQWAALKRTSYVASKYPVGRSSKSLNLTRVSAQMAQGILSRLYTILRESCPNFR